jgi:hypothetical protein
MDKNVCAALRLYKSVAFDLTVPVVIIWFQNRRLKDHNPDFALQQSVDVRGTRLMALLGAFHQMLRDGPGRSGKKTPPRFLTMVEYYPQLNHSVNPFVESPAQRNFVRQRGSHV